MWDSLTKKKIRKKTLLFVKNSSLEYLQLNNFRIKLIKVSEISYWLIQYHIKCHINTVRSWLFNHGRYSAGSHSEATVPLGVSLSVFTVIDLAEKNLSFFTKWTWSYIKQGELMKPLLTMEKGKHCLCFPSSLSPSTCSHHAGSTGALCVTCSAQ